MTLELGALEKAIDSFEKAIYAVHTAPHIPGLDEDILNTVKAGVIQNFEFTYELCWKFIKRWLETNYGPSFAEGVHRRELFRQAAENGLIDDVALWMDYHQSRNLTSHTYDQGVADDVFEAALTFLPAAKQLLEAIARRND
jgi:nucleotidyltransferase substrate binding protein (TIGR01987 family)